MAKTPEQKRDAYYLKKYGVGLDWYNARFEEQGGKCAICRRPQSTFLHRLAIDHDHAYKKVKIVTARQSDIFCPWHSVAMYLSMDWRASGPTKAESARKVKSMLKAASCRGLLCPFCNRGLRFYADDPTRLANAAEYLRKHQNA